MDPICSGFKLNFPPSANLAKIFTFSINIKVAWKSVKIMTVIAVTKKKYYIS